MLSRRSTDACTKKVWLSVQKQLLHRIPRLIFAHWRRRATIGEREREREKAIMRWEKRNELMDWQKNMGRFFVERVRRHRRTPPFRARQAYCGARTSMGRWDTCPKYGRGKKNDRQSIHLGKSEFGDENGRSRERTTATATPIDRSGWRFIRWRKCRRFPVTKSVRA